MNERQQEDTWLNTPLWKEVNQLRFALRNAKGDKRLELVNRLNALHKKIDALPAAPPDNRRKDVI